VLVWTPPSRQVQTAERQITLVERVWSKKTDELLFTTASELAEGKDA
jgi:hypothetical protein